ncbi:MAG: glycosyltransferase family 4 protein [Candidatus Diapherotrites archaeon]
MNLFSSSKVVFLSTYPPRECGIATFTKDLSDAIHKKFGSHVQPKVIAMEENQSEFRVYNKKVVFNINEDDLESYGAAAKKINSMRSIKMLNIQHEFGIFGGDWGENILHLMELVKKKIIVTFHTVLEEPEEDLKRVVERISEKSDRIVVMTNNAKEILANDYGISAEKIVVIPHGGPNVNFSKQKNSLKKKYGLKNSKVLLTFGLLSRGKGVELVIKAMPEILKKHPDAFYLVIGETHPKVREEEGESYRLELKELAKTLGVEKSVKFLDKYLSLNEIVDFLNLSDVYLAPSIDPKQICSGTVSYAMAAGKAIISSRNKYNEEVLANGRGIMLKRNNPKVFAKRAIELLDDGKLKRNFEIKAFDYSRRMTWQNVSAKYYNTFSNLLPGEFNYFSKLPRINFRHFYHMTDDFGMIQFADYSKPLRESGYTLDDNARAISVSAKGYGMYKSQKMIRAADTFMGFIEKCQISDGYFHNVLDINRDFADDRGSEDSFGRAIHAMGNVLKSSLPEQYKLRAKKVLEKAIGRSDELISPRAQANSLIGMAYAKDLLDVNQEAIEKIANSLVSKFEETTDGNWEWFEKYLTYGNSIIPEALFEAGKFDETGKTGKVAATSMDFLTKTHFIGEKLVPIGQDGWFKKDQERSFYDQQPIEAGGMTIAYLKAYNATGDRDYLANSRKSFEWFLGRNSSNQMVYDDSTGGCFDGITSNGVNLNQGAESLLAYLNARLTLQKALAH